MAMEVRFSKGDDVLIARVSGVRDAVSDEATDRQVARACRLGGYSRVLMDFTDVDVAATTLEAYHAGTSLGKRGFNRTTRIAILDRPEFKEANDMYGLVARNRGFQLQHFYTEQEAMAWLVRE